MYRVNAKKMIGWLESRPLGHELGNGISKEERERFWMREEKRFRMRGSSEREVVPALEEAKCSKRDAEGADSNGGDSVAWERDGGGGELSLSSQQSEEEWWMLMWFFSIGLHLNWIASVSCVKFFSLSKTHLKRNIYIQLFKICCYKSSTLSVYAFYSCFSIFFPHKGFPLETNRIRTWFSKERETILVATSKHKITYPKYAFSIFF